MRLLVSASVLLLAAAPDAYAQEPDAIVADLTAGVRCSGGIPHDDLTYNLKKIEASKDALVVALNLVTADESRCAPVRDAARQVLAEYVAAAPASEEDQAAAASRAIVAQALAEANARAESLKFDVGPPPRNMTKGRDVSP